MRKKQNLKKVIIIIIFVLLCVSLISGIALGFYFKKTPSTQNQNSSIINDEVSASLSTSTSDISKKELSENTPFSKKATFRVGDDEFVIQVTEHTTVYDAMNNLMSEGKMTFEGKDYPALGFFVTQINSLVSGDGKNLMYYINDKEASVGVSVYVIKEGDIIEWKLK